MTKDSYAVNLPTLLLKIRLAFNIRKQNHETNYPPRNTVRMLRKVI